MAVAIPTGQIFRHRGAEADDGLDIRGCRQGEQQGHGRGVQRTAILNAMAADASSLHCPNCGAAVDPDARRCPYCKARLATVSCPSCFALMFDGAKFCPSCGAERARTADPAAAAVICPGCNDRMALLRIGTTELFECAACDGLWVDAATSERLCTNADDQAAVLHKFSAPGTEK